MIASQQEEVLRIFDFISKQQGNCLDRLLTSINIVSEEEIVGLRWETSVFKNSQQVIILAMHISTDLQWSLQLKQIGLTKEYFS